MNIMDNRETKLLSVIIPTYKRDFITVEHAIVSIENQTYPDKEIYVIDDNRGEEAEKYSAGIKKGLAERHAGVHYVKTGAKHGAQAARNKGIEVSHGCYLAFLDDDDVWEKTLAEKEIALLETNERAGMAYCMGYNVFTVNGKAEIDDFPICGPFKTENDFRRMLRADGIGTTTQAIIKRSALEDVGGFDETFPARQDYEMWLRLGKKYLLVGVPERLYYHSIHEGEQISKHVDRSIRSYNMLLEKYHDEYRRDPSARRYMYVNLLREYKGNTLMTVKYRLMWFFAGIELAFLKLTGRYEK